MFLFFILLLWYFVYFIKLIVFEHFYFFKKIKKKFGQLPTDLAFNSGALGGIIHVCARLKLTLYIQYLYIAAPEPRVGAPPQLAADRSITTRLFPLRVHHLLKITKQL